MTDRLSYRFDSEGAFDSEIADCTASDLAKGSGQSCKVQILTCIIIKKIERGEKINGL